MNWIDKFYDEFGDRWDRDQELINAYNLGYDKGYEMGYRAAAEDFGVLTVKEDIE